MRRVERVLHVSLVPTQTSSKRIDEIARLIGVVDGGNRVLAHADEHGIPALELAAIAAVEEADKDNDGIPDVYQEQSDR